MARPEMNVILAMGDGDSAGIGGNHLIHACRRNIDLTAIIFNNEIYGLTGGQAAPTTTEGKRTTTTPDGNEEPAFDICELSESAGASFVARTTTFDFQEMSAFMTRALAHEGFSVLEVMTTCPTYLGRLNKWDEPYETLSYVPQASADTHILVDASTTDVDPSEYENPERIPTAVGMPITEVAKELGNEVVANVVALGVLNAREPIVDPESLRAAVRQRVPERFRALNEKALDAGESLGLSPESSSEGASAVVEV